MDEKMKVFKAEFDFWADKFGLRGWDYFFEEDNLDSYAQLKYSLDSMAATVSLDKKLNDLEEVKQSAKHEAIHLLLARLTTYTYDRFVVEQEIKTAIEEVVNLLTKIL